MKDICFTYLNTNTQGRLGTHTFDLVLPPLGIAYLAAVLEEAGHSVEIIDANAEGLSDEQLLERIRGRFRIVGFYCHTQCYHKIVELAGALKHGDDAPRVIIGGPHATALPEGSLAGADDLDVVVFGEGEVTVAELVPALLAEAGPDELAGIQGIVYRDASGRVTKTAPRPYVQDLDSLPMPAWHLLPMPRYRNLIESGGRRTVHLMGSRGCPINCNYCFSTRLWSPRVRWHSAERVLAEMEHLQDHYGIAFFQFLDDNFTLNRPRFRQLATEFRDRGVKWCCSTRIDLIDDEAARYLALAKVDHVCIGIETVNDRLLGVIGKKITRARTIETLDRCEQHGIPVLGMFIVGIPTETDDEARETIDFALARPFHFAVFSHMTIYPGTGFWEQYGDSDALNKDFSAYCLSKHFTYVEEHRSLEALEGLMRRAYLRFYTRPRVVLRLVWLMLRNPREIVGLLGGFFGAFANLVRGSRKGQPAR